MAFNKNDIYTSSGSTYLQNAWIPYVSKFDTSTFYNWEQDNVPLYDLEDRTYELWEQQGYPTSSIPGLALSVSADAPELTLAANPNIFTSLSACIAAIPKVVRFPVLIEVCNFGNLGKLELHNFRIEEGGSIEIINRAFSKVYGTSAVTTTTITPTYNETHLIPSVFSSIDLSSTLYSTGGEDATSSIILSSTVLSSAGDVRASSCYSFIYPKHSLRKAPLSVSIQDSNIFSTTSNEFAFTPYEDLLLNDGTKRSYDISAYSEFSLNGLRRNNITTNDKLSGLVSLNYLESISVKNCDGPIYIRNFVVDGEATSNSGRRVGININNSEVVLENCASTRCKDSGFKFINSNIILSRSAFSYRNYDLSSSTERIAGTGVGFNLINSEVTLSANLDDSTGDRDASGFDVLFCASRNETGFKLDNSVLKGGFERINLADPETGGALVSELNTDVGVNLNNSKVDLNGLFDIYANNIGIFSNNSNLNYTKLCVEYNSIGIKSYNSSFLLDSKDIQIGTIGLGQSDRQVIDFRRNGQHLILNKNSFFGFKRTTDMPSKFGGMIFSACHGIERISSDSLFNKPALLINDNSTAELIHCVIGSRNENEYLPTPTEGVAARVSNNSRISMYGTGSGCTVVVGNSSTRQEKHSAIHASKNSQIDIHGPTLIGQTGIPLLAENNSVINISPPITENGQYDVNGFSLDSTENHTSVELQSSRSCIVVNKNSTLNVKDLGYYSKFWSRGTNGQAVLDSQQDYNDGDIFSLSSYISNGSLQFYPNPNGSSLGDEHSLKINSYGNLISNIGNFPTFTSGSDHNYFLAGDTQNPDYSIISAISLGGTCIRSLGGSEVLFKNVHFPLAVNDSALDGLIYEINKLTCDRLMIWNIADNSKLNATYLSVSGNFPSDVGFHGPSATYFSADPGGGDAMAYGALSSTPDTGRLSVLDQFGAGSGVAYWSIPDDSLLNDPFDNLYSGLNATTPLLQYGQASTVYLNQGPFRLYFSVDPAAKLLQVDASGYEEGAWPHAGNFDGVLGPAYQIFAQGYNLSSAASAITPEGVTDLSSFYPQLLKYYNGSFGYVGFYNCIEFVENNPNQCTLDESAAETFANAKNCSTGISGRPKKVTIHRSRLNEPGSESFQGSVSGGVYRSSLVFDLDREV